jgi:hypothetical protein
MGKEFEQVNTVIVVNQRSARSLVLPRRKSANTARALLTKNYIGAHQCNGNNCQRNLCGFYMKKEHSQELLYCPNKLQQ